MTDTVVIVSSDRSTARVAAMLVGLTGTIVIVDDHYDIEVPCNDGIVEWSEAVKVDADPKPDPRRSRITARGGRSDDWKGHKYGRR